VRQQVGRHEGAVRVTGNGHAIGIYNSSTSAFVDSCFSSGNQLLDECIIWLLVAEADDRHGGIIQHGVPLRHVWNGA